MEYLIKKGKHYHKTLWRIYPHIGLSFLSYNVVFDPSCWYNIKKIGDHTNKLFGLGFGINHHKDSIRVGWRPVEDSDKIALYSYTYHNGERFIEAICKVSVNTKFNISIIIDYHGGKYKIVISDLKQKSIIEYSQDFNFYDCFDIWGFRLFPYFGGNPTAPDDVKIHMDRIRKNTYANNPTKTITSIR